MMELVQVLPLDYQVVEGSELTDLFLHVSTKSHSVDELLEHDNDDFKIVLKMTDGDSSFRGSLRREDIIKFKHEKNNQSDLEWVVLLIRALFDDLPLNSIDTVEINGREVARNGSPVLEVELKTKIGPSIYQTLGVLELTAIKQSEDINYADDLFEWSKIMSNSNKKLRKELLTTRAQVENLRNEIKEMNKFQEELVRESKLKDQIQLKIMTKLLNAKKNHYEQLSKGEITDDPDDFNLIAIKNIKDELVHEEEENKPKVKRPRKTGGKKQPRGLAASDMLRKRNITREYPRIKDEKGEDDFIPDSQDESERKSDDVVVESRNQEEEEVTKEKPEVKEEEETKGIPMTVKAKPEESIHFKFKDEQATDEDANETVEEKQSNDGDQEDEGDETLEDTENDTDDDQEMNDQEQDTVTDTDTESEGD